MNRALVLSVHFVEGRYHGQPDWPPSPARLFQALVAAAANGMIIGALDRAALVWLEQLSPPSIVAPPARAGQRIRTYVPNNDLDAVDGDPGRVSEIRAPKTIRPQLFDARRPLVYAWEFTEAEEHAVKVCELAKRIYQLGRGVDMAWASAEVVDATEVAPRLAAAGGACLQPTECGEGVPLLCPQAGSFTSLEARFAKTAERFVIARRGRKAQQLFSQAPKARFAMVGYDSPPRRYLFELRHIAVDAPFAPWPLARAAALVNALRDAAAERLARVLPDQSKTIERVLVGRNATEADKTSRVRIVPLPSIGSIHVVRSIRRVLVEVPPNCPLRADDISWAFSGLDAVDPVTGEIVGNLVTASEGGMAEHYGIGDSGGASHRVWRTVTPAVLPEKAARRRIDPEKLRKELDSGRTGAAVQYVEAKASREWLEEEGRAAAAVKQALRHTGMRDNAVLIKVQREPFEGRGERAEAFADGTRFAKERLWHVEVEFVRAVRGPLLIGDGRYLGLGLMAPQTEAQRDVAVFALLPRTGIAIADGPLFLRSVRRALMAVSRDVLGRVPRLFSGHEGSAAPAASGRHEHVFLGADDSDGDGRVDRLIVAAPWACDRSTPPQRGSREAFEGVVSALESVRAGRLGVIGLDPPTSLPPHDRIVGPAFVWDSLTVYRATRHAGRNKSPKDAVALDLLAECARRGWPRPDVEILEWSVIPGGGGLQARARLRFAVAVYGPLFLGRDSHKGGGVFAASA